MKTFKNSYPSQKLIFSPHNYREEYSQIEVDKRVYNIAANLLYDNFMKIHHVLHLSLLEPYYKSTIVGKLLPPLPSIEINHDLECKLEEVLDS